MFTLNEVLEAAALEIEIEGPDYRYTTDHGVEEFGCLYVSNGVPSCLIGRAMHRLGVSVETLEDWDNSGINAGQLVHGAGEYDVVDGGMHAADVLDALQGYQDSGVPWGTALARARTRSA